MLGKKLLWLVMAMAFLTSTGCCRMWDRWCHDRHHNQAAPHCPPTCAPVCPPGCAPSFSSPAGVTPVPSAPAGTSWQRCP